MNNTRIVVITTIIVLTISLIVWIRTNQFRFDLRGVLPFLGGSREGTPFFDFAALAVVLITCWGMWRLFQNRGN